MIWRSKFFKRTYAHIAAVATFGLLAASAALAQPDIIIRDCPNDSGLEPDNDCYAMYASQDIWIRNNHDFGTIHQSPIAGQRNWVSVRLTNIGNRPLNKGKLHVYFAKASTGLVWWSSWINNYIGGVVYGDEIGSPAVAGIAANTSTIVTIPWDNVPDPQNYNDPDARHFCMLARFESSEDPITFTEGPSIEPNVRNNNNIAWKNVSILDRVNPRGPVEIENNTDRDMPLTLRFRVADGRSEKLLKEARVTIRVELPARLLDQWKAAGEPGEGVKNDGKALVIDPHDAWIGGMWLGPKERQTVHVEIGYNDATLDGEVAQWDITQHDDATGELIGGERYDIDLSDGNDDNGNGKVMILPPKHNDLSSKFSLATYPNPVSSTATIRYTLPGDTRVTLSIFDASGRMVQEIVSNAENTAGSYEALWDGTAADGTKMPSGTYICRLSTSQGSTEQQIKIMR